MTKGKTYKVMPVDGGQHIAGMLRILDDNKEIYFYPGSIFEEVQAPPKSADRRKSGD